MIANKTLSQLSLTHLYMFRVRRSSPFQCVFLCLLAQSWLFVVSSGKVDDKLGGCGLQAALPVLSACRAQVPPYHFLPNQTVLRAHLTMPTKRITSLHMQALKTILGMHHHYLHFGADFSMSTNRTKTNQFYPT